MATINRVLQEQRGTRKLPISDKLNSLLTAVGDELDVYFVVTSGGQPSSGPNRTGSHRHDEGGAADLMAFKIGDDGNRHYFDQSVPEDRAVWSKIIQLSVAGGATGVGMASDYMGNKTAHIGYGKPAAWGAGGKTANAPDWVKAAYVDGQHTPPMNIPQVASKLDVKRAPVAAPIPRERPAALMSATQMKIDPLPTSLAQLIASRAGTSVPPSRQFFAPLPAPEPLRPPVASPPATILGGTAVTGKASLPAAVSTILGGGSGVSNAGVSSGRKLPNPTVSEARAEQALGRKAAATPAARSIVPALGRSAEQVARDEQNAIQSGYRAVQEGNFPAAPNAPKQLAATTPAAASSQPGVQKSTTVYVRPDGATRTVDLAGSVQMPRPIATPTLAETRAEQQIARSALTRTIEVEEDNPAYFDWLHTYANASGSPDDRDARSAMSKLALGVAGGVAARIPVAPPRRITVTRTVPVHASVAPAAARLSVQQQLAAQQAAKQRAAILSAHTQAAASGMPQAGQTIMTENNGAQIIGSRLNGSERGYTVTNDNWFNSVRGL